MQECNRCQKVPFRAVESSHGQRNPTSTGWILMVTGSHWDILAENYPGPHEASQQALKNVESTGQIPDLGRQVDPGATWISGFACSGFTP